LIYKAGDRTRGRIPVINHPVQWIIDTMKELMDWGYLVSTDNRFRNSIMKSSIDPIINLLVATESEGISNPEIREAARLVLDSDWFRNFFSYSFLQDPITYRDATIYEPYRNLSKENPSGSQLEIKNLKNRLFQLMNEIGYYSHNIRLLLKKNDKVNAINLAASENAAPIPRTRFWWPASPKVRRTPPWSGGKSGSRTL